MTKYLLTILSLLLIQLSFGQNKTNRQWIQVKGQYDKLKELNTDLKDKIFEAQNAAEVEDIRMYCSDIHINTGDLHYEFRYMRTYLSDLEKALKKQNPDDTNINLNKILNQCYLFEPYLDDIYNLSSNSTQQAGFNSLQTLVSSIRGKYDQMMLIFENIGKEITAMDMTL